MDHRQEVIDFVASLGCEGRVAELLEMSVQRVLLAEVDNGGRLLPEQDEVQHVVDWMRAAVARNEPWLSNVDDFGRPKKLMKFSRFDGILKEADKAVRAANAREGVSSDKDGQTVFEELANGFRIVRLVSKGALQLESKRMQHCVGQGGYDYVLGSPQEMILSLRDRHDKPHVTMHVDKTRILQLRGKQNKRPLPEYMRAIAPLTQRLRPSKIEFGALGFVVDTQGVRHELTNLPDGVDVDGGLVLNGSEITSLAKGMTVRGDLDLAGSMIDRLPEGLTVHGSLVLSDEISGISKIDQLPNDIVVHRKLDMRKTKITEIPSGARIGSIDATLSKLRKLPDGFSVDGDAKFGGTNITKLPARMYVGGDLGVWHTGLTEIPADLSCGGINCSSNPISVLPSGVVRDGGSVDVSETRIRSLPANLKAGYRLDISQTAIDALPTDVSGVRNLNASLSKLAKLPSGLRLDSLNITCTPISEIPPDLSASGSVWLAGTKVRKLPDNLDVFSLGLEGCDLATLPDNLRVRNNIYMNGSPIEFLPDGLVVEGDVEASGSRLAGIGANVTIGGNLMAARSRLKALPDDLRLGTIIAEEKRELDISGTKIAALPKWNVKFAIVNITKTPISEIPAGWTVGTVGARNSALREVAGQVDVLYHNTEGLNVTGRISSQVTSHPIVRAFSIALAAYKTALVIVGRDITQVCRLAAGVLRRGVGLGAHAEHS